MNRVKKTLGFVQFLPSKSHGPENFKNAHVIVFLEKIDFFKSETILAFFPKPRKIYKI